MNVPCTECGAELERKPHLAKKYSTFFCNSICKALFQKKYRTIEDRKAASLARFYKRMEDPEYRNRKRAWDRAHHEREKLDPTFRKRRSAATCKWQKKKRLTDPLWAEKRRAYARDYYRRKSALSASPQ